MKKLSMFVLALIAGVLTSVAQWGNNAEESVAIYTGESNEIEMAIAPNGNTWVYLQAPTKDGKGTLGVYLQLLDSAGNKLLGEQPLLISAHPTRTWTTCNTYLFVDRDGNAIVAVHDIRNAPETQYLSYHIYKISQEGEYLWGKDGLALEGAEAFPMNSHMSMAQLDDNSYVFTWNSLKDDNNLYEIKMQRITPEGEMLWNIADLRITDPENKISYTWPTVVDAGMNQAIIIFFKGSSYDMYARKIDFDGASVWSEDTRLYRAGWPGSMPAWSMINVEPSGDGGALVAWNDDRYLTGMATYMTYVKGNGEIGFAAGVDGQRLSYGDYLGTEPVCKYDPHTDSFLAVWREAYSAVMFRTMAQRLSKDGELMWGEEGLELHPFTNHQYGYFSIQTAPNEEAAFFYMHNQTTFSNTDAGVTLVNTADPTLRRDFIFTDTVNISEKAGLISSNLHNNSYWTVLWEDAYIGNEATIRVHRVNTDLTVGSRTDGAVEAVKNNNTTFSVVADMVQGNTLFAVNTPVAAQATLAIYDMRGALVATPFDGMLNGGKQYIEWNANVPAGVYVATLTTENGVETAKLLVK